MDEEVLGGGLANAGAVVRRGSVVSRPAPPQAAALHEVLRRLARSGFDGVPTPVRIGPDGTEEFAFVPGDVAVMPYPAWSMTEQTLASVGALVRRYHDVARAVPLDTSVPWPTDLADPEGGSMLCHNDVCIENVVFRAGEAVALIDFDFAAPGRPVWDVAKTARYWVPMVDPQSAATSGRDHLDRARRARVLADAYGVSPEDRLAFVGVVELATEVGRAFIAARMAADDPNFVKVFHQHGGWERWDRLQAWLAANRGYLTDALLE